MSEFVNELREALATLDAEKPPTLSERLRASHERSRAASISVPLDDVVGGRTTRSAPEPKPPEIPAGSQPSDGDDLAQTVADLKRLGNALAASAGLTPPFVDLPSDGPPPGSGDGGVRAMQSPAGPSVDDMLRAAFERKAGL